MGCLFIAGSVCELLEEEGGIITGPVASCHGGTNLVSREGNVIGRAEWRVTQKTLKLTQSPK